MTLSEKPEHFARMTFERNLHKKLWKKIAIMNIFPYLCKMMNKILCTMVMLPWLTACTQKGMSERLDEIDSLVITEQYDSAYAVLSGIRESSITEASDNAHYYLLQTQIGYLVNQPLPSDS